MPADRSGVQVNRHCSDEHSWAFVTRAPDFRLLPYVIDYQGYRERAHAMRRLQPPFAGIPMIVTFGPSIDIINGDLPTERGVFRSFLAGLHDVHVLTEYEGEQTGFQVNSPCSAPIASSTSRCPTSPIAASISATCWVTRRPTSLSVHCRMSGRLAGAL